MPKFVKIALIIYAIYLSLVLLVVTPLLNFLPHKFLSDNYGRELETGFVWVNPFTVSLEVRDATLPEKNGERFVDLDAASVNLSLASIWRDGIVFDRLGVEKLYAHVQHLREGEFNFSDLLGEPAPEEPETESAPLPGVTVGTIDFTAEALVFTDKARAKPFSSQLQGLALQATNISTVLEAGQPYKLNVSDESGGNLNWEGTVSIPDSRSEGNLNISKLGLEALWRFAEPWVNFELTSGALDISGDYLVDWKEGLQYRVKQGALAVAGLDIAPKSTVDLRDTALKLERISVANIAVDSSSERASVASVTLDGLTLAGFSEGSRVSLQELFTPVDDGKEPTATEPDAAEQPANWQASIGEIALENSEIQWRSEFTDPPILALKPLSLKLGQLNWPLRGSTPIALNVTANDNTPITVDGELTLGEGGGDLSYSLEQLPLALFNPALPDPLRLEIDDGKLSVKGQASLAEFSLTQISADGAVKTLALNAKASKATLGGWQAVTFEQLAVDLTKRDLALGKLSIDGLTGQLHISKDGTVNTSNVWQEGAPDEAGSTTEGSKTSDEQADSSDSSEVEATAEPTKTVTANANEQGDESSTTENEGDSGSDAATDDTPWSVSIPTVLISNGKIDFMDQSLPIEFRTLIGDLNGRIEGLSSAADATAQVGLKGSVDGYAPVALDGTANPLKTPPSIDLRLTFDGVDLARVTPYSGTYAGYAIDRGLLDLDLKYELQDNHLQGNNEVIIDQLKLGKKVASDKAVNLPLQLAISLLTDANGVINMRVPVAGDLDDPKFKLGGVIFGAFVNLITKAATAPFSLLANLVGSDDDLQHVTFTAGSASLDDVGKEKLITLTEALQKRPNLNLIITGQVNPEADREGLQKIALNTELMASGVSQADIDERNERWERAIEKRYKNLDTPADTASVSPQGTPSPPTPSEQYDAVRATVAIEEQQLTQLAEARATAVKTFLIGEAQLATDRAVIEQSTGNGDGKEKAISGVGLRVGK